MGGKMNFVKLPRLIQFIADFSELFVEMFAGLGLIITLGFTVISAIQFQLFIENIPFNHFDYLTISLWLKGVFWMSVCFPYIIFSKSFRKLLKSVKE